MTCSVPWPVLRKVYGWVGLVGTKLGLKNVVAILHFVIFKRSLIKSLLIIKSPVPQDVSERWLMTTLGMLGIVKLRSPPHMIFVCFAFCFLLLCCVSSLMLCCWLSVVGVGVWWLVVGFGGWCWCHPTTMRCFVVLWSSKIDDQCNSQNKSKWSPRGNSSKIPRRDFFEFKSI